MGVKLSSELDAETFVFTTSESKRADAKRLGAVDAIVPKDEGAMAKHSPTFDFILDTVGVSHNLDAYTGLLKRRSIEGSAIGDIRETQEMLDFCGKHGITSDIELIPMQKINEAYERMLLSDAKYRFVIDMGTM